MAAFAGGDVEDFADFFLEAFVEHTVCFVKDDVADVAEVGGAFVYEVVKAVGRSDDYVSGFQGQALRVFEDVVINAHGEEIGGGGEGLHLSVDLHGEFAG